MTLWLMSYINQQEEGVPMPGKLAFSSPGSALTAEERKPAGGLITRLPAFFNSVSFIFVQKTSKKCKLMIDSERKNGYNAYI